VRLLGPVQVVRAGREVRLGGPRPRAVLALLVLAAGRVVPADRLVEEVWRGSPPPGAAKTLRSYVSRLRAQLDPDATLAARGGGYVLGLDPGLVDAVRFERLAGAGQAALSAGEAAAAAEHFREALGLWRGAALADVCEVEPLAREAARLEELRLAAAEGRIEADLALGRHAQVTGELEGLVAEYPVRERLWRLLVLALYRAERQADALAAYRRARDMLADELGLEPGEELRRLEQAVLRQEVPPLRTVPGGVAAATRTLPRDLASFTGREQELGALVAAAAGAGGVVGIHAIGGMAGVGKTAFAVHAAHRLAERFPAGQIFLPLHGHSPGQQPVDPADALASLLLTAGVPAAQIPSGLQERMALWRDRLAEKQLLLILDDAASSDQVRPLLPGAGRSLVLVTSRRRLSALDDAATISLDTLPPGEAAALLVRLAGRAGLRPADPPVGEITRLCGYLPLAIGMVARQLHHHPAWTPAGRAAELAAAADRLELMATENVSVAAAFDLSYANLTSDQQRLFRRLGLHPGPDIDGYAAAALDGTGMAAARRGLEVLYDRYLLTEPAPGRYRMHDLIRAHARALAEWDEPEGDRDQATARLLDYYQHTAARADTLIARQARPGPAPADGAVPAAVPPLADREQALAWARAERASLLACLDQATATGQHAQIITLTADLAGLLRSDGPWAEAITRHTTAVQAAQHLGDRLGLAGALTDLGAVRLLTDEYPAAARALEQALGIYRDLGDRVGQANALLSLGGVRRMTGDYPAAARALKQALGICRAVGDRVGQANALNNLGDVRRMTGDYPAAAPAQEQALGIYRDLGDRAGQANALLSLGDVRRATGQYPAAARALEQALGIYRDLGDRVGQANALLSLGDVRRATGQYPAAAQALEQALAICRALGSRLGQANALYYLGDIWLATGQYPAAAQALAQALGIYRDLGDRGAEATALNEIGMLHRVGSDLTQAEGCHQQALELARAIGSSWDEAHALAGLGRCALAAGHADKATDRLRQALEIFQRTGAAEAVGVSAELGALAGAQPAAPGS
jgi:DNA-binding SARP family transcriptional activator